jgi:hypothetical protein
MEQFWNGTILESNKFEIKQIWNWTLSKLNKFGIEQFLNWTILKWNNSEIEHFWNWTILNLNNFEFEQFWNWTISKSEQIFENLQKIKIWTFLIYNFIWKSERFFKLIIIKYNRKSVAFF